MRFMPTGICALLGCSADLLQAATWIKDTPREKVFEKFGIVMTTEEVEALRHDPRLQALVKKR